MYFSYFIPIAKQIFKGKQLALPCYKTVTSCPASTLMTDMRKETQGSCVDFRVLHKQGAQKVRVAQCRHEVVGHKPWTLFHAGRHLSSP